jgi:hypothetical protein
VPLPWRLSWVITVPPIMRNAWRESYWTCNNLNKPDNVL